MSAIKDGGPAFPIPITSSPDGTIYDSLEFSNGKTGGMTLRDYFAIRAPEPSESRISINRNRDSNRNPHNESHKPHIRSEVEIRCDLAYEYADAMLRAREKS